MSSGIDLSFDLSFSNSKSVDLYDLSGEGSKFFITVNGKYGRYVKDFSCNYWPSTYSIQKIETIKRETAAMVDSSFAYSTSAVKDVSFDMVLKTGTIKAATVFTVKQGDRNVNCLPSTDPLDLSYDVTSLLFYNMHSSGEWYQKMVSVLSKVENGFESLDVIIKNDVNYVVGYTLKNGTKFVSPINTRSSQFVTSVTTDSNRNACCEKVGMLGGQIKPNGIGDANNRLHKFISDSSGYMGSVFKHGDFFTSNFNDSKTVKALHLGMYNNQAVSNRVFGFAIGNYKSINFYNTNFYDIRGQFPTTYFFHNYNTYNFNFFINSDRARKSDFFNSQSVSPAKKLLTFIWVKPPVDSYNDIYTVKEYEESGEFEPPHVNNYYLYNNQSTVSSHNDDQYCWNFNWYTQNSYIRFVKLMGDVSGLVIGNDGDLKYNDLVNNLNGSKKHRDIWELNWKTYTGSSEAEAIAAATKYHTDLWKAANSSYNYLSIHVPKNILDPNNSFRYIRLILKQLPNIDTNDNSGTLISQVAFYYAEDHIDDTSPSSFNVNDLGAYQDISTNIIQYGGLNSNAINVFQISSQSDWNHKSSIYIQAIEDDTQSISISHRGNTLANVAYYEVDYRRIIRANYMAIGGISPRGISAYPENLRVYLQVSDDNSSWTPMYLTWMDGQTKRNTEDYYFYSGSTDISYQKFKIETTS